MMTGGNAMAHQALMRSCPSYQISNACRAGGSISDNLNYNYTAYSFKSDLDTIRIREKNTIPLYTELEKDRYKYLK